MGLGRVRRPVPATVNAKAPPLSVMTPARVAPAVSLTVRVNAGQQSRRAAEGERVAAAER